MCDSLMILAPDLILIEDSTILSKIIFYIDNGKKAEIYYKTLLPL